MKNIIIALVLIVATPVMAGNYNIDICNNCNINVQRKVVRVVPAGPGPVSSTVAVPLVPVYNYVPTPEASNIYSPPGYPTNVPVATSGNCAMYVDPYDLFGQLFGGADLVQSCLVPAY